MIRSIGTDIIEIDRIRRLLSGSSQDVREKLFTKSEIDYCESKRDKYASYAARFAAKEALSKALGQGMSGGLKWRDIEVLRDNSGKPSITLAGSGRDSLGDSRVHISLSHSKKHAVATVLLED
jgi:holo-[acyl-carrier protein] synthase